MGESRGFGVPDVLCSWKILCALAQGVKLLWQHLWKFLGMSDTVPAPLCPG